MRYHYEKPPVYIAIYGATYICDHPVYSRCTLFKIKEKGWQLFSNDLIQMIKRLGGGEIDPWLTNELYLHPSFKEYFDERAGECIDGLYPTVTIRQMMLSLKMKPIKRKRWETCFDRRSI